MNHIKTYPPSLPNKKLLKKIIIFGLVCLIDNFKKQVFLIGMKKKTPSREFAHPLVVDRANAAALSNVKKGGINKGGGRQKQGLYFDTKPENKTE